MLKGPILAIFPQSCPPTAANVVLQALLFILVVPPCCGFPGLFGPVLSQDGQTRGGSSPEQCPGPSARDELGDSKAAHGTCESGNPKRGSRTHSAAFPPLLSCPGGKSPMGIAWKQRGCQRRAPDFQQHSSSLLAVLSKVFCTGMTLGRVDASLADKARAGASHAPDFFATFSCILSRLALGWSDPAKSRAAAAGSTSPLQPGG